MTGEVPPVRAGSNQLSPSTDQPLFGSYISEAERERVKSSDFFVFADRRELPMFRNTGDGRAPAAPHATCACICPPRPLALAVPRGDHLFRMNILIPLWWEVSCWEELECSHRRRGAVVSAAFLSPSVFPGGANVIAGQPWARSGARLTVRILPGLLIVLGSNKNKHWVSGRAVYALQTNGDWECNYGRGGVGGGGAGGWEMQCSQSWSILLPPS